MGDFNLNLLNCHNHKLTNEFLDTLYSNMFFPLITRPTRITSYNATLIDNIFTNDLDNCSFSGLFFTDISDHLPIFCLPITQDQINNVDDSTYVVSHDMHNDGVLKFCDKLRSTNWTDTYTSNDPIKTYNSFTKRFTAMFETCFPMRKQEVRLSKFSKPWMSNGLLASIKTKNKLYKKYLKKSSHANKKLYTDFKNKLNHSIRIAKRLYFETKLKNATSDIKRTWQIQNEVINRKKCKSKLPSVFYSNNQYISDPIEVANRFCDYFTNIGPNLAKQIPISVTTISSYLRGNFPNSLFFHSVSELEVIEIVKSLHSSSASGHDKIPVWIVKNTIDLISEPICSFVNFSIETGIVPSQLKIAGIIPIYKSGVNNLFSNYRPISVLPVFSKVLEKAVYNRLMNYIDINHILFSNQYGFRKNHSTSLALISLYDKISAAFDANKHTVGIFLDLSKAFDTVDHTILISKLEHYGILGLPLEWIHNYLSNRFQYVEYNGFCSLSNRIKCGVPQGLILGPLLLLLYINDIYHATDLGEFILFADDTNLFYSHDNASSLTNLINSELSMLSEWFQANKLSVNISKTNYIIFKPRQKKQIFDLNLKINNKEINRVNEVCFLGVILDENLSWKAHISHIAHKISKSIGIIYR